MIGRRVKRPVDPRLLRGQGQYIADLRLPGMLHAAFEASTRMHESWMSIHLLLRRCLASLPYTVHST
jgi:aerobic carbon-monoxide dehydrogenase large subunit